MSGQTYNSLLKEYGKNWCLNNFTKEDLIKVIKNKNTLFNFGGDCCICYEQTSTNSKTCKVCKEGIVCGVCLKQLTENKCPICRVKWI